MAQYPSLEVGQAGNPPCPDQYNAASTLICPGSAKLLLQISGQPIVVQLGVMPQGKGVGAGAVVWQAEQTYLPLIATLARAFDAVRVRNRNAGSPAEVIVNASD